MKRIRISGLVRMGKQVRQELSGPIGPERLARLRRDVREAVTAIEGLLKDRGMRPEDLPTPSRRAYQFLKGLNFDSVVTQDTSPTNGFSVDSISFPGLQSHLGGLLDELARCRDRAGLEDVYDTIRSSSEDLEGLIAAKEIGPEQIKKPSREARGWLAYFSQWENFGDYVAAVRRAEPAFRAACPWATTPSSVILIHFRPMRGMYRIRHEQNETLVRLPTPTLCFDRGLLESLAQVAFRKSRNRQPVLDAAQGEPYQRILSELELLGGIVAQTRGLHHDLAASFDRVNAAYFDGSMARPRLVWSRSFATRKFGHYDQAGDTVMVSMTLDKETVPAYAVDRIVYHELLHKQLGVVWKGHRMAAHTPEFLEKERRFVQYNESKAVLRKLTSER